MDGTIDTLRIVIKADTSSAKRGVDSFSKSLTKLSAKATESSAPLSSLLTNLSSVANLNFSGITNYLNGLTGAIRIINKEAAKTARLADKMNGVSAPAMPTAATAQQMPSVQSIAPEMPKASSLVDQYGKELKPAKEIEMMPEIPDEGKATASVQECTDAVKESVKWFGEQEKAAKEAGDAIDGNAKSGQSEGGKEEKSASVSGYTSKIGKLFSALKRIFLYRMIRALLKEITRTLKNGINNLVTYDDKFNASLSTLKSSFLYVTNAIGASFAPVIEALTPILDAALRATGDFANNLAELFAIMNGSTSFSKATMTVEDYAQSLKAAKSAAGGFDELNVLSNAQSGDMFTTEQIDTTSDMYATLKGIGSLLQGLLDPLKKIGSVLLNSVFKIIKSLEPLLTSVCNVLIGALNTISPILEGLLNIVTEMLTPILDSLAGFLDDVATPLFDIINAVWEVVSALLDQCAVQLAVLVSQLVTLIGDVLSPILEIIASVLPILTPIFEYLGIVINTIITMLSPIIDLLDEILSDIGTELVAYVKQVMPVVQTVLQALTDILEPFFDAFGEYFADIFEFIKQIYEVFSPIIKKIDEVIRNVLAPVFDWITTSVNAIVSVFEDVVGIIHSFLTGDWDSLKGYWNDICSTMGNLWNHLWKDIANVFVAIINGIIDGFQAFINLFVKAINGITSGLSKVWTWLGIPEIPQLPEVSLTHLTPLAYANGGFPEDGMFFANSSELVGQFDNGKTAVANNAEIIEGIRQGVLSAMKEAQGSNGETSQNIIVQIDGEEVASKIKKESAQTGPLIYSGGVL